MSKLTIILFAALLLTACKSEQTSSPAPEFTALFMGDLDGFTGGDGTYSVLLPDGQTAWIFGDTFIDGVGDDNTRAKQDPIYIRNSLVLQDDKTMKTIYNKVNGKNASFAIPHYEDEKTDEYQRWFWPGDGFIENNSLKIFFSEFTQRDTGMWGFHWESTWIGTYSLPNFEELELIKLFDSSQSDIHFGHAVFTDSSYTYIYGAGAGKPHVARYPRGKISDKWDFFNGSSWSHDIKEAKPMAALDGSEQFSVFKYKNKYVFLSQMGGLSTDICSYTSSTPIGPWENKKQLYSTPLPDSTHNLFTYNALAHPQFIKDNLLLVSYNTNSKELKDHYNDASIYRPRFIWVPLNLIDSTFKY